MTNKQRQHGRALCPSPVTHTNLGQLARLSPQVQMITNQRTKSAGREEHGYIIVDLDEITGLIDLFSRWLRTGQCLFVYLFVHPSTPI